MDSYIVDEIILFTQDEKSRRFYELMVQQLGEQVVHEEFSVMKDHKLQRPSIKAGPYLAALLKKRRGAVLVEKGKAERINNTYFEETPEDLLNNLCTLPAGGSRAERKEMATPYSKNIIPWATFLSSCFFTLSTNKAKSDNVTAKFRTMDGQVINVPMLRGRLKPGGKEFGIPTVEHGRVLAALESIWAAQGCQYHTFSDSKAVVCFCLVSIRELAGLLGRTKFGGRDLTQLTNKVWELKSMPYYLDLAAAGQKLGGVNRGFSLLQSVELAEGKRNGQLETVLRVEFSPQLSAQLKDRHTVSRPKEIAHIQSELGFLMRLHIEAALWKLNGTPFKIPLRDLIAEMALPASGWHSDRNSRKRMFEKAIKAMGEQRVTDGRCICFRLEKGITDWLLVARLVNEPALLAHQL